MGLDMYLYVETFFSEYQHKEKIETIASIFDKRVVNNKNYIHGYVKIEAMYWRKANHIHGWFVKNVQNNVDDCRMYPVTEDHLKELLRVCKLVKEDNSLSCKLLPLRDGFFFGTSEYDNFYFSKIDETINRLDILLSDEIKKLDYGYFYTSSW